MQIIRGLHNLQKKHQNCAITIGNFDGIHKGHQQLINKLTTQAKQLKIPSVLVIFEPNPREYFADKNYGRIISLRRKYNLLKKMHIDYLLCINFNKKISSLKAEDFIKQVINEQIKARYLLIGDDFQFGKNKKGNFELLKKFATIYNYTTEKHDSVYHNNQRISSSLIRQLLQQGNIKLANFLLGHNIKIEGKVVTGNKIGKKSLVSTANINTSQHKLCFTGVFLTKVTINKNEHYGLTNIGYRPTIDDKKFTVETYILEFNQEIYQQNIKIELIEKIREEQKFNNILKLKEKIQQDIKAAKAIIKKLNNNTFRNN